MNWRTRLGWRLIRRYWEAQYDWAHDHWTTGHLPERAEAERAGWWPGYTLGLEALRSSIHNGTPMQKYTAVLAHLDARRVIAGQDPNPAKVDP